MKAVAYYRTSSKSGLDGDSEGRQQRAISEYAERHGIEVVAEYYDEGVSGTIPVNLRPEFCRMMDERKADTILVETASRFARDLMVQEIGRQMLKEKGLEVIPVDDPTGFTEETPTSIMIRQILGAAAQFEKSMCVHRMRAGLDRVARENGRRMEGNHGFKVKWPEVPHRARMIAEAFPKAGLREVASMLALNGYTRDNGEPFHPGTVARWVS